MPARLPPGTIDLHTHTAESDGTTAPCDLVEAACDIGLEALGITDHDTLAGYDEAVPAARQAGLALVCGIELSNKWKRKKEGRSKSVHILGYFPDTGPAQSFRDWLHELQENRRDRNRRLAASLRRLGVDVTLEEVEKLGRSMAGRPHFARILVSKGYASGIQAAFDLFLGESAKAYVDRREPSVEEGIRRILDAGGLPSLAHPVRLWKQRAVLEAAIEQMQAAGLAGLEVYHSDHNAGDAQFFLGVARRLGLVVTGGTDFHGDNKPGLELGAGYGNVRVPRGILDGVRAYHSQVR